MADQIETGIIAESIAQPPDFGRLLRMFAPAAAIPIESHDADTAARKYRYWQKSVLLKSNVDLEYLAFDRRRTDCHSLWISRGYQLATRLLRSGGDRLRLRHLYLVYPSRHAAFGWTAGSRRHRTSL